jgi:hypothetical protein
MLLIITPLYAQLVYGFADEAACLYAQRSVHRYWSKERPVGADVPADEALSA